MVCPCLATEPLVQRRAPGAEELDLDRAARLRDRILDAYYAGAETALRPGRVSELELENVPNPKRLEFLLEEVGVQIG